MNEIFAIKKDTPHVRANKINERIARYPGMPQIYHKESHSALVLHYNIQSKQVPLLYNNY